VRGRHLLWPLVAALTSAAACAPRDHANVEKEFELGEHRVRVLAPEGWELADQGTQKRFRNGESQIVLVDLEPATRPLTKSDLERLGDLDQFAEWGLAVLGGAGSDQRREVRSRRTTTVDSHEAVDVETWNRLDHTWPQRLLFLRVDGDLFALHTPGRADADTMKAFEAILGSLHFIPLPPV
jgi:hypothetical protein